MPTDPHNTQENSIAVLIVGAIVIVGLCAAALAITAWLYQ